MPALAPLLALAVAAGAPAPPPAPRTTAVALEGHPLRLAALPAGDAVDLLLLRGRDVERLSLSGRKLTRQGSFRAPQKRARPLWLDAARVPGSPDAVVAVLVGEDATSVDQGTDTALHAYVLSAPAAGGLAQASGDLKAYLRVVEGRVLAQARGPNELFTGPVRALAGPADALAPAGDPLPWATRWLLDATPLPGGTDLIAWDRDAPVIVAREEREERAEPLAALVGGLGPVREPQLAVRLRQPAFRTGFDDRQGETWQPVPRRIAVAADGAAYTLARGRSRGAPLVGRSSGEDAIVRLDHASGELTMSRPYPGVPAWILDFALLERADGPPAVLLLVNEKEDGSGRAQLVLQEPE